MSKTQNQPKPIFAKDYDDLDIDATYRTFGINVGEHSNQIEIYGNAALRDLVLSLLQQHEQQAGLTDPKTFLARADA